MKRLLFKTVFFSMLMGLTVNVLASNIAEAEALIKKSTVEVLEALQTNSGNIHALVDKVVLPNFDFNKMSALVLGQYWKSATTEQKTAFATEFRHLLVRTYSTALIQVAKKVNKEDIEYSSKPTRKNRCQVSTNIKNASTSIKIDYAMYNKKGAWKVYNVIVEGVSLVTNYRDEFGNDVKRKGMDGLIAKIRSKNKG
ncbi:MAG: ABC transporter substrate-binding protein [Candidatus Marithrix sp.]